MSSVSSARATALQPVWLALGQTVYVRQCFEGSLVALLALFNEEFHGNSDGQAFQATIDRVSRKTIGQLLPLVRDVIDVPVAAEALLAEGLELRNRVVHRFADEFAARMQTPEGRAEVVAELLTWRVRLVQVDDAVHALLDAILRRRGLSLEGFVREADEVWELLNASDSGDAASTH